MLANILSIVFGIMSVAFMIGYSTVARRLLPGQESNREILSWIAMFFATSSTLLLLLAFFIQDPQFNINLSRPLILISVLIGLLLRQSAISSHELVKFWLNLGKKKKNKNNSQ